MEYFLLAVSAIASRLVNWSGAFRAPRPHKILVIKLDHLGDVVTATPVFRVLCDGYPGAPVHALIGPWARDILEANPFIDRILEYDSAAFRRAPGRVTHGGSRLRRMREIAAERYTVIVDLRGDAWTLALPFLCGARTRVDRGTVRIRERLRRLRLGHRRSGEPLHEVETNLAIVRPLLARAPGPVKSLRVEMFLTDEDRRTLAATLDDLEIQGRRALITIHPSASWRPRAWRPEQFAALAARILERYPVDVVFVGTAEDRDIQERLRRLIVSDHAHYLFTAQSIRTVSALIERSVLMIGSDSGLTHIAAACGTPVIALFGPQDPRRFGPWSRTTVALHKPVPCFPCRQTVCVRPEIPCVNLIEVEEVLAAARPILERAAETARA